MSPPPPAIASPREVLVPDIVPHATAFNPSLIAVHNSANAFSDEFGRTLLLRGINVSGDAKYPANNPLAGTPEFYDTNSVSYVGRPFSVDEAEEWWKRLKIWGIGVVRMVVCWEGLEPRKMGDYDDEYIDYLHDILEKARKVGLLVFIDGHQDTWSRFTGGSGAPLWTFHLAGLDPQNFQTTCSAALDSAGASSAQSTPSGRLWPTNYSKFGVATMFTLFYAGEIFAPSAIYSGPESEFEGKNVGYVLRMAYCRAYAHLASRLRGLPNVMGFDPMNEPHPGYIGLSSLNYFNETTDLHLGYMPNALQSMSLAAGIPTSTPYFSRSWPHPSRRTRNDILNKECVSAWLPGRKDIWLEEGVFVLPENDGGVVKSGLRGDKYFTTHPKTSEKVDFEKDFYVPFLRSFQEEVMGALKGGSAGKWMFVEPVPNLGPPVWDDASAMEGEKVCYSPHWYDIRVLFEKSLNYGVSFDVLSLASGSRNMLKHTYLGRPGLKSNYATNFRRFLSHLSTFRSSSRLVPKPTPILIGETGIPFDINSFAAYSDGNIHTPLIQLDAIFHGMEQSNLNWTFWNLTLSNNVSGTRNSAGNCENQTSSSFQTGDGWNSEDFSIVSSDPAMVEVPLSPTPLSDTEPLPRPHDAGIMLTRAAVFGSLYKGARLAPAFLRPYPTKTAGLLERACFELETVSFEMSFIANAPTPDSASSPASSYFTNTRVVLDRTTELFLPAYHFGGGRDFTLSISIEQLPAASAPSLAAFIPLIPNLEREMAKRHEAIVSKSLVNGVTQDSEIVYKYIEAAQTLLLVHKPGIGGRRVEVAVKALLAGEESIGGDGGGVVERMVGCFV